MEQDGTVCKRARQEPASTVPNPTVIMERIDSSQKNSTETQPEQFKYPEEFCIPYDDYREILSNNLLKEIRSRYRGDHRPLSEKDFYSPLVHMQKKSGRCWAAFELGRITNVLYIDFSSSEFGKRFVSFFSSLPSSHRLSVSYIFNLLIQRLLFMSSMVISEPFKECIIPDFIISWYGRVNDVNGYDVLFEGLTQTVNVDRSFKSMFECNHIYDFADFSSCQITSFGKMTAEELVNSNEKWLRKRSSDLKAKCGLEAVKNHYTPSLLIVCDEADYLRQEYNNENSTVSIENPPYSMDLYELLKGGLRLFRFYWFDHLCITVSTRPRLEELPKPEPWRASYRKTFTASMPAPIVLTGDILEEAHL